MTADPIVLIVTITPSNADSGTPDGWRDNVEDAITAALKAAAITVDLAAL